MHNGTFKPMPDKEGSEPSDFPRNQSSLEQLPGAWMISNWMSLCFGSLARMIGALTIPNPEWSNTPKAQMLRSTVPGSE